MNEENENSINPVIEVDSTGKIFVARTDYFPDRYNPPYYEKIWISTSPDRGVNWESKILIENEFIAGEPAMKPGENGNIYLVCGADEGIYCLFSTDSGSNWQVNQSPGISGDFWVGQYSSLRIQEDKLFLIWNTQFTTGHRFENWIHFVSGTNNGADWTDIQAIDYICNTNGPKAAMTVNGININLLLYSGASLFLLRSTDEGETWSYPEFIPGTESSTSTVPLDMVTADTEKIYMVYINVTNISSQTGSIYFIHTQ
jgi:Neuraminidase (sialidase)